MQRSFKLQGQTLLSKKLAGSITGMGGSFKASTSLKFNPIISQKRTVNFFNETESNDAMSVGHKSNTSSMYNKNTASILKSAVR